MKNRLPADASLDETGPLYWSAMPGGELDENRVEDPTKLRTPSKSTGFVLRVAAPGSLLSFPLPNEGEICVGRGLNADLRVPLPDMSRRHCTLKWTDKGLTLCDMGSSNGTVLRGEKLSANEWTKLSLREPIVIGDAVLIVHEGSVTDAPRRLVGHEAFEAALEAHIGTFAKTHEPFGVCAIELTSEAAWSDFVVGLVSKNDVVGFLSESAIRLLLVNRTPGELDVLAGFLAKSLTQFNPARKVEMRACPRDGNTMASLYSGVRTRARDVASRETRRPSAPVVVSAAMRKVYSLIDEVAPTPTSILILGETGVGKDVLARSIHQKSDRVAAPLVGLNCAALPESLLESELFGYERGAFTGAVTSKQGLLESAEGGTVFLDEVGEMPLATQAKLLRVLEERKVMRLGGLKPKTVNFRLLSATNRNLQGEISAGRFRADLFYRINGLAVTIPPLRERRDEIIPLAMLFAEKAAVTLGKNVPLFSADVLECLERYMWPGNIRELKSVVERAVLLSRAGTVMVEHLPEEVVALAVSRPPPMDPAPPTLTSMKALKSTGSGPLPSLADEDDDASPHPPPTIRHGSGATPPPSAPASGTAAIPSAAPASLRDEVEKLEYERIVDALKKHGGNQTRAAKALGITRRALIIRLERYGLPRPRKE